MKSPLFCFLLLISFAFTTKIEAQKRRIAVKPTKNSIVTQKASDKPNTAIVVDESLSVLRSEPSLFAMPLQRVRRGRIVAVSGSKEADGVTFYRVKALPNNSGWMQAEAVVGKFRRGDDERLAKLIQASDGFEQAERAQIFLDTFADSPLRPTILLLSGDLMEEAALKLSGEASKKLDRREMAASGAPLHSFYLNYTSLDRYRKINVNFLFNSKTNIFHYDGACWREIVEKFPKSAEAVEAQKRLDLLKQKMNIEK